MICEMTTLTKLKSLLLKQMLQAERNPIDGATHPITGRCEPIFPVPFPAGASRCDIGNFGKRTGIALSEDMAAWLMLSNAPPGFCGIGLSDEYRDIESLLSLHPHWARKKWLPVGYDEFGNYFLAICDANTTLPQPIAFVDICNDERLCYVVGSDMLHFAEFMLEYKLADESERGWPFDERFVVARDPEIIRASSIAPLPWHLSR